MHGSQPVTWQENSDKVAKGIVVSSIRSFSCRGGRSSMIDIWKACLTKQDFKGRIFFSY